MEQHPIPRQITTFEFKLIGFMTLRQFLYLLVSVPSAFVVMKLFPIPILNLLLAVCVAGFGVALAFLPINDRPMDVWIKNLYKRLTSPTQYVYQKENDALYFLKDLYFLSDPHRVVSHIESKEKLAAYLQQTRKAAPRATANKAQIQQLLKNKQGMPVHQPVVQPAQPQPSSAPTMPQVPKPAPQVVQQPVVPQPVVPVATQPALRQAPAAPAPAAARPAPPVQAAQHPFLTGMVKNSKQIPLPGVLVYIKNDANVPLRLLKTNPHGVFATYNPLPAGQYNVEIKDPNSGYFFDTMKVQVSPTNTQPFEFYSKEML